jgi:23S rRNA pseudouridine2605 synthase
LTREQLNATRAERWHQNGEALLTLESAQQWLKETGICLFLPRKMQLPAPAPSFVEACQGETNPTPSREAIEAASALLVRLVDAGEVIALNLLGMAGEQPDFLVTPEFLPYIFSLRGDRDWKHDPPTTGTGRVSPLVLEVWKALERTGVQTAIELRETLGKELTEAAVLRALNELWTGMRIILLPGENGEAATWEALKTRFEKPMAAGTSTSQVTALSVLLARYLQSAVAATSEEAEIFLSPLASRSKVREVIRGLSATRQLATYSLDALPLLYVEGTLPEFGEPVGSMDIEAVTPAENSTSTAPGPRIRKYTPRPVSGPDPLRWKRDSSVPVPPGQRRSSTGDARRDEARDTDKPAGDEWATRRSLPKRPAASSRPGGGPRREGTGAPRRADASGEKKRWTPREGSTSERPRREGGFSKPAGRTGGSYAPRREGGSSTGRSERPAFGSRPPAARGFGARPSGPRATGRPPAGGSYGSRPESGEKKRFTPGEGFSRPRTDRPSTGRPVGRPRSDRPAGDRPSRPYTPRPGVSRPPSSRPTGARTSSDRPSFPKRGGSSFGPRRVPGAAPGEGAGSAKKGRWVPRTGSGDGRSDSPRRESSFRGPSGRTSPRSDSGRGRPSGDRPSRPYSPRPTGDRPPSRSSGGDRPSRPSYTKPWAEKPAGRASSGGSRSEGSRPRPEAGFERKRPSSTGAGASDEHRPRTFGARPAGARPAGARSSSSRPSSARPSSSRPSGGRPSGGKTGFKSRSGGKPAGRSGPSGKSSGFGKKRGPGDFPPRKKRPE